MSDCLIVTAIVPSSLVLHTEDGGDTFHRNVGSKKTHTVSSQKAAFFITNTSSECVVHEVLAEQDEQHLLDAVTLIHHILHLNTSTPLQPRKVSHAYGPSDKTERPCGNTGGAVIAAAIYGVTPELSVLTDTA
jgi:hypothetical protein